MDVSVIIPTFNRGYIITDAIASVAAQSYRDYELLVVDDGSTDDTADVVQRLHCSELSYIRHETNRGCSAAYNSGLSAASGSLVAFLDSDDLWHPRYLDELVGLLDRHPEVDAVFCDAEIENGGARIASLTRFLTPCFADLLNDPIGAGGYLLSRNEFYRYMLQRFPIKPSACVFRKSLYTDLGGFDDNWPSGTDYDLFVRYARSARFAYLDRLLVVGRIQQDSTHVNAWEQDCRFNISFLTREKSLLSGDHQALAAVNRGLSAKYRQLGGYCIGAGRRTAASTTFVRGFTETRDPDLALRAVGALLPGPVIRGLRRLTRR